MARLRRAATVPNAVAASSIGQLIHLHVKIQMKKKWPMVSLCRKTRRAAWKTNTGMVQILQNPVRSSVVPVSSSSMKTKVDMFLPHDVRKVVLIPFFLQFSGFREDDIAADHTNKSGQLRRVLSTYLQWACKTEKLSPPSILFSGLIVATISALPFSP